MHKTLLLILVVAFFACSYAQIIGARVIVTSEGINDAIKKYSPDLEAVIMASPIADIHVTEHVNIQQSILTE
jgi:hypothetical protein